MARKPVNCEFTPKNPAKYIGTLPIICRSSWEFAFCRVLDQHPNILRWSSESIEIKYIHPETRKSSTYYPDFFIDYIDRDGIEHNEIVEIKPERECPGYEGYATKATKSAQAVNAAKWEAARAYCTAKQWAFRPMTEHDLFVQPSDLLDY